MVEVTLNPEIQEKLKFILKTKNQSLREKFPEYTAGFDHEKFPLNVRYIYPDYKKYILELGCGWGEFAIEYSQRHPEYFYLAMDKKRYRIKKSLGQQLFHSQKEKPMNNLQWMVCNFDWYFQGMFQNRSFDKIIINFPDPWPKKKQAKHRFIKYEFINSLYEILNHNGIIEFATDSWNYMENALSDFNKSGRFENINGKNIILNRLDDRPQSFFELLKREEKENIYIIQLRKLS